MPSYFEQSAETSQLETPPDPNILILKQGFHVSLLQTVPKLRSSSRSAPCVFSFSKYKNNIFQYVTSRIDCNLPAMTSNATYTDTMADTSNTTTVTSKTLNFASSTTMLATGLSTVHVAPVPTRSFRESDDHTLIDLTSDDEEETHINKNVVMKTESIEITTGSISKPMSICPASRSTRLLVERLRQVSALNPSATPYVKRKYAKKYTHAAFSKSQYIKKSGSIGAGSIELSIRREESLW